MLETLRLKVTTPCGRVLFQDLNMVLERERVALIGRNGVGKSTLLEVLAGVQTPHSGQVVRRTDLHLVGQLQTPLSESHGQLRKKRLIKAFASGADILLLDEPTQDLDAAGVAWLRGRLTNWQGGLLVASHDRGLLRDFQHFFVLSGICLASSVQDELVQPDANRDGRIPARVSVMNCPNRRFCWTQVA